MALFPAVAVALLMAAIICFFTKRTLFGIPPLMLEGIGVAMVASYAGWHQERGLLLFMVATAIAAAIFDPLIWKMRGVKLKGDKTLSLALNGALALIILVFYVLGSIVKGASAL